MVQALSSNTEIKKTRAPIALLGAIIIFGGIFLFGLKWIFALGQEEISSAPFLFFDYSVGLTMIFLPCTLPLAFVIVPLVMAKSYGKGVGMALAFGAGVTATLSIYGILIGFLGQMIGIDKIDIAKNVLYALAGGFAVAFALGELGLIKFRAPSYSGGVPGFIQKRGDLFRAGLLGLFLGNVGVGCPNPLFNAIIIPQIIVSANPFSGWLIMFVQALGRITPLFILAFLAILGVNAAKFLVRHKEAVARATAWSTIFIGGFLLTLGLFSHSWWTLSGSHSALEIITRENFITNLLGGKIGGIGHTHEMPAGPGLFGLPIAFGTWFLLYIWIFPMIWYVIKRKQGIPQLPLESQECERKIVRLTGFVVFLASIILILVFGYLLPHQFSEHWSKL